MQIKTSTQSFKVYLTELQKSSLSKTIVFFVFVFIFGGISVTSVRMLLKSDVLLTFSEKAYLFNGKVLLSTLANVGFSKYIDAYIQTLQNPLDKITIDIKHKEFQKLAYQRRISLENNGDVLLKSEDDYIPGTIQFQGESFKVKLRLKGLSDHWNEEKTWSFRIKVREGKTLFGMRTFALQHPKTRGYIMEWLLHQAFRNEGGISLRYNFVRATLNGEDWGIYALEEHLDKRLLENNQRTEGAILKFDDELIWKAAQTYGTDLGAGSGSDHQLQIRETYTNLIEPAFSSWSNISKYPTLVENFKTAAKLLAGLRQRKHLAHEIMDIEQFAIYVALCDLFQGHHGLEDMNMMLYFNPVTSLFEPISHDTSSGLLTDTIALNHSRINEPFLTSIILTRLFEDIKFIERYVYYLEKFSKNEYLVNLLESVKPSLESKQSHLLMEYNVKPIEFQILPHMFKIQEKIRTRLETINGIFAYYAGKSVNQIHLDIGTIQEFPVQILGLSYKDQFFETDEKKLVLMGKQPKEMVDYRRIKFSIPSDLQWTDNLTNDFKIRYKILGASKIWNDSIELWSYISETSEIAVIHQVTNLKQFNFLSIDELHKKITISQGKWKLDKTLVFPSGYSVHSFPGVELDLINSAKIISYSPLFLIGNQANPIMIKSSDGSGQGLAVIKAKQQSEFSNVIFDNLNNPVDNGWSLTGAITFYESPIKMDRIQFINNNSEDYLNVKRSSYLITNSLFLGTKSDAFDADFSTGTIKNTSFINIGNDAIDVSGGEHTLESINIQNARDKGLSVGENGMMFVKSASISDSEIAIASKDKSTIIAEKIIIKNSKIGITAFQKKSEFGPGNIQIQNLSLSQIKIPFLIEKNSSVIVNGIEMLSDQQEVKKDLYGVKYGKSSK
jgi:hypothetical protein